MLKNVYVYFILFYLYCASAVKLQEKKKGPYAVTVLDVCNCSETELIKPHPDYGKIVHVECKITHKSNVHFNLSVHRAVDAVKVKARGYFWESDRWALRINVPGFGCSRRMVWLFFQLINLNVDKKCHVTQGIVVGRTLDLDILQHAWETEGEYGRWRWIFNFMSRGRTMFCLRVDSETNPTNATA